MFYEGFHKGSAGVRKGLGFGFRGVCSFTSLHRAKGFGGSSMGLTVKAL